MSVMRFLAGFAVGAALGAVAGILLAPKSGEETREMLGEMASDLAKKTDATVKDIQKKLMISYQMLKKRVKKLFLSFKIC